MTRIAAGHPGIWPDICAENRTAIVDVLDAPDRRARPRCATSWPTTTATGCSAVLDAGPRRPGSTCPAGSPAAPRTWPRSASRCPTAPGAAAEVITLAAELDVNIADLEIAHSSEGDQGVLILLVEAARASCSAAG